MKPTKARINELAKEFTHVLKGDIKSMMEKYKTERGFMNALTKANEENERVHARPLPEYIEIELTWRRSTYGNCPRGSLSWLDSEGWHYIENATFAGGWGYDKTSTILAECLNKFRSLRWSLRKKNRKNKPYGVYIGSPYNDGMWFDGGIGESCYYRICDWMGYKMEHTASGKTYDKFVITRKGFKK